MLIASTFLWGASFPLTKYWQIHTEDCPGGPAVGSLTLLGLRTPIALLFFALFQRHLFTAPNRRALGIGLFLGFLNFLGCFGQVLGLAWTQPALSGFITSLASAWVPLLAFLLFRLSIAPTTFIGIAVGIAGAAFLEMDGSAHGALDIGEGLTLLASVLFALVILLLDRLGKNIESSHVTVGFVTMTGLPAMLLAPVWAYGSCGLSAWTDWLASSLQNPGLVLNVVSLTLFCTVLAYHWMTSYQPRVPASRAALVYLLEPLWAAVFSIGCGYDALTFRLILGGGLILGGNLLVELPLWMRSRVRVSANDGLVKD
jgi:drug/metabolite transporter (DMT)-like permease